MNGLLSNLVKLALTIPIFIANIALADPAVTGSVPVIGSPYVIEANSTTNLIYVGHKQNASGITVINGATDTVVTNFAVGIGQVLGVAVNEALNLVYVSNSDGNLYIVDGNSNTVVGSVALGQSPNNLDFNPTTNLVYVARSGNDTVSVVDGITYSVVTHINVGDWPWGVVVNSVTNLIYVTNSSDGTASVIDGDSNTVTATIPLSGGATFLSVNENSNKIYASVVAPRGVDVIDGNSNTVQTTLSRLSQPQDTAVNPISGRLYITNYLDGSISVLDGNTFTELTKLSVGDFFVIGATVNPTTHKVYVSDYGLNTVSVITDIVEPIQLLLELSNTVMNLNLQRGIENSLDAKLDNALGALSDAVQNNDVSAVNTLNAFISQTLAQKGNKITAADADRLIADAEAILALLL